MRAALSLCLVAPLLALSLGCRPSGGGERPYAFHDQLEQRYRLTGNDSTRIDDVDVEIERVADLRLEGKAREPNGIELVLRLTRFYLRVDGAPGGPTELAISDKGLITRGGSQGDLRIAPDSDEAPDPVAHILENPLGGVLLDAQGRQDGTPWFSRNPVLAGIDLLEWVVLALPVLAEDDALASAWSGSRTLPAIGQYRLGLELPLRYTREADASGATRVLATGLVQRAQLAIAPGLRGDVHVDFASETQLASDGRIVASRLELLMRFEGDDGTRVQSRHKLRLECLDCGGAINPATEESDTSTG